LDRPVLERYGDWLVDAVQLDFGSSLLNQGGPSIVEEIRVRIPATFSVALSLITAFAIDRDWFPALGYTPFEENPWEWLRSIFLPAVSIGLVAGASVARQVRAAIIDALQSN